MSMNTDTKPNGPVAAAIVAGGIGSFVLGLNVVLVDMSDDIKRFFDFSKAGLGPAGVGPLSGKVVVAVLAFVVSWVILHFWARGKEVNFGRWFAVGIILVALGFALTFPPIFELIVDTFKGGA